MTGPEPEQARPVFADGELVTGREFDALSRHVEAIDAHGSRGLQMVQAQLAQTAHDLAALAQVHAAHERTHEQERKDRENSHRWLIASVVIPTLAIIISATLIIVTHR